MTKVYLGVVRSALVVIGLSVCGGIALRYSEWGTTTAFAREPDKPADDSPKTAEQQFKNIQALKGVPAEQLLPTMQFISASLGVECDFCHVDRQMDKDDKKEKQTARKMIAMQLAINGGNFDGKVQVTCHTCHRGSVHPVGTPILSADAGAPHSQEESSEAHANLPNPAAARSDAEMYFPVRLKEMYNEFQVLPQESLAGHASMVVAASGPGRPPLRLYFDQVNGLLSRLVRYTDTPLGRLPTQIDYADYRETDGVKIPYRWTLTRPSGSFRIRVEQVQQNVAIDEGLFVAPSGGER